MGCSAPAVDESPEPSEPLEVGFGEASLVWRVGAKPGQVGTDALRLRDEFFGSRVGKLLPIVAEADDPPRMLENLTQWAVEELDLRVEEVQPGVYNHLYEPSVGVELPPYVSAVVIRRGDFEVAVVRADLFIMHEQIHRRVAALIEEETGIGRDQLFITATHNHSCPHAVSAAPGVWTRADSFDPRHFSYVTHQIAAAIRQAHARLEPAELRSVRATLDDVQHNIIGPREIEMRPPGGGDAQVIEVGYPYDYFDSDLMMLRFDSPDGAPIGAMFVFGMHPESLHEGHGLLSGEWPSHVERRVSAVTGVPTVWLPGPLGDVEPDRGRVHPEHEFFRGGFEAMEVMSGIIADAVVDAWSDAADAEPPSNPVYAQIARDVHGPADHPVPDLAELGFRMPMPRVVQDSTAMRLHLVRLGDVMLVGLPGEITTDLSRNIKTRLDTVEDNVHQGYVWPSSPEWVRERIARNFSTSELPADRGVPLPMIVSQTNAYFGYVVSRWEYENREHYRQSMTPFGPGTADHIANAVVSMARELDDDGQTDLHRPAWHEVDTRGVREIEAWLAAVDARTTELARMIPTSDPNDVGVVLENPPGSTPRGAPVALTWIGGTNDMDPPVVHLEREVEPGQWESVVEGPNGALHLLFEAPNQWTVVWRRAESNPQPLRLRGVGTYRGSTPGVSDPDPLFDPDGANVQYTVVSAPFSVDP